jgi:hypothetical protein
MDKVFDIGGFFKFKISKTEYNKFIKKIESNNYIVLKKTKSVLIFLELSDLKEIKECLAYVFFTIDNEIKFQTSTITFKEKTSKSEILKIKKEVLSKLLLNSDNADYSMDPYAHHPYGVYKFK